MQNSKVTRDQLIDYLSSCVLKQSRAWSQDDPMQWLHWQEKATITKRAIDALEADDR